MQKKTEEQMIEEKEVSVDQKRVRVVLATLIFIAFGTIAPLLQNQLATGILVNALLFTAVQLMGLRSAIFVGLFPSLVALAVGFLPLSFGCMIPFIILSNALLVVLFHFLKGKPYAGSVILCSVAKFLFLFLPAALFAKTLFSQEVEMQLLALFGGMQLLTALMGGALSKGVVLLLRKTPFFRY